MNCDYLIKLYSSVTAHGDSKPSSNIKDTSRRNADDSVPVDNKDSTRTAPKLFEVYKFDDLEVATQNFLFLCHGSRDLFIGWVDKNTFTPSLGGMGIEVAVEWYSELQPKCQVSIYKCTQALILSLHFIVSLLLNRGK